MNRQNLAILNYTFIFNYEYNRTSDEFLLIKKKHFYMLLGSSSLI